MFQQFATSATKDLLWNGFFGSYYEHFNTKYEYVISYPSIKSLENRLQIVKIKIKLTYTVAFDATL